MTELERLNLLEIHFNVKQSHFGGRSRPTLDIQRSFSRFKAHSDIMAGAINGFVWLLFLLYVPPLCKSQTQRVPTRALVTVDAAPPKLVKRAFLAWNSLLLHCRTQSMHV
ncbi:hypothetical protein GQ600_22083 [Phytophthora cactorum]|nr:hypothetical protein GQ600_22083 [Phytophthora cactorum]